MRRIVIDCDPGIDDAQAIMMAYCHPDIKIEAITTVSGNVGVEHTAANALKILDVLDAETDSQSMPALLRGWWWKVKMPAMSTVRMASVE